MLDLKPLGRNLIRHREFHKDGGVAKRENLKKQREHGGFSVHTPDYILKLKSNNNAIIYFLTQLASC